MKNNLIKLTPEILKEMIEEQLQEAKKKKNVKPTCSSREDLRGMNRFHDSEGNFSTKAKAKSSSVRNAKKKPCRYDGQAAMPGEKITRIKCGRKDASNPDIKAKFKCKNKAMNEEDDEDMKEQPKSWLLAQPDPIIPDDLTRLSKGITEGFNEQPEANSWKDKYRAFIASLTEEERSKVKKNVCSFSPDEMAQMINNFSLAIKGDLDKKA
jgi:hypothetical protein